MHSSYARYSNYKRHVEFKRVGLILNAVREYYHRASGEVIGLDLGCGQGDTMFCIASLGYHMVGMDVSQKAIVRANIRKTELFVGDSVSAQFIIGDIGKLPLL